MNNQEYYNDAIEKKSLFDDGNEELDFDKWWDEVMRDREEERD